MPATGSHPKSLVHHAFCAGDRGAAGPQASTVVDVNGRRRSNRLDGQELAGVNVD
jgi:hypothetical protein